MIASLNNNVTSSCPADYGRPFASNRINDAEPTNAADGQTDGASRSLSEEEQRQVQQLKQRDQQVRAHERAHMAAGADLVQGGATFTFERGPDGRMYAVGGEVKIDTSGENDPDRTIRKMQQVKRAALAPAEPSGADRAVAAQAGQAEAQARREKNQSNATGDPAEEASGHPDRNQNGRMPAVTARRPYSAEAVGRSLDVAV